MHAINTRHSQEGNKQPAERAQDHEMFLHKQLPDLRRDDRFTMFAERASSLRCVTGRGSPGDEKVITLIGIAAPCPIRLGRRSRRKNRESTQSSGISRHEQRRLTRREPERRPSEFEAVVLIEWRASFTIGLRRPLPVGQVFVVPIDAAATATAVHVRPPHLSDARCFSSMGKATPTRMHHRHGRRRA